MKIIINKLVYVITALCLVLLPTACKFGDTNVDPSLPTDVSAQAITPAAQSAFAFAIGGEIVRINGLFMQHFEGINAQQSDNYKYLVKAADMDGIWNRMYYNTLNPLATILRKAEAEDSKYTAGMCKILIAHSIGSLADMFGDIPYTDALKGLTEDVFFPTYDTQESVYTNIQTLLDEAIVLLSNSSGGNGPALASDDLIYGGNTANWLKVAHSLKAKYYIHLSKVNVNNYTNALNSLPDGIASNDDDFQFNFGTAPNEANPQYQFSQDRGGNIAIDKYFFDLLNTLNDPRRKNILDEDLTTPSGYNKEFNSGTYYSTINSPVVFMSYAEAKFIEAEAELMGNSDANAAQVALSEAIEASLIKITGSSDIAYVAINSNLLGLPPGDRLKQIIMQKYIALYSHGLESWIDYRRTGFPALTPADNGSNAFNLNGELPRRLPYPQTEIDLNKENVPIESPNFQNKFWWDI